MQQSNSGILDRPPLSSARGPNLQTLVPRLALSVLVLSTGCAPAGGSGGSVVVQAGSPCVAGASADTCGYSGTVAGVMHCDAATGAWAPIVTCTAPAYCYAGPVGPVCSSGTATADAASASDSSGGSLHAGQACEPGTSPPYACGYAGASAAVLQCQNGYKAWVPLWTCDPTADCVVAGTGPTCSGTTTDGTVAALKEPDLPNTSKILNCCASLESKTLTKSLVANFCPNVETQVAKVLNTYQSTKQSIKDNVNLSAQSKTVALNKLKSESQTTLEPAARCLLAETVGKLGNAAIPKDCEAVSTIGSLPAGKTCEDVKSAITNAQ